MDRRSMHLAEFSSYTDTERTSNVGVKVRGMKISRFFSRFAKPLKE